MDIELGQPVITNDGENIGDVERLVIDPEERVVREFLIKEGTLLSTDRVVDIELITRIDDDGIHLSIHSEDADSLPAFVEDRYVTPAEHELNEMPHAWIGPGAAGAAGGGPLFWSTRGPGADEAARGSMFEPATMPAADVEPDYPIDQSSVVIDEGTKVVDRDEESVGSVEEVHYDASGKVSGFRVKSGLIFTDEYEIPMTWIESIQPDAIHLSVTQEEVSNAGQVEG